MKIKILIICLSLINFDFLSCFKSDLLIFSYDRPMQLYALLESINKYINNLGEVHIIYRTSNDGYLNSYQEVINNFSNYYFHRQGNDPQMDFKPLVMKCVFESPNKFITFAVDDIIVKDHFDISICTKSLKKNKAYGFYLRLGKNINYCYMMNMHTPLPEYQKVLKDIFIYQFKNGLGDWNYPNSVDMTIYNKSEIKNDFLKMNFIHPSDLEGQWSYLADQNKKGLFFSSSKIVNIPVNTCMNDDHKNMKLYSTDQLLEKFAQGLKIDINKFYCINNNSPHMEYQIDFVNK